MIKMRLLAWLVAAAMVSGLAGPALAEGYGKKRHGPGKGKMSEEMRAFKKDQKEKMRALWDQMEDLRDQMEDAEDDAAREALKVKMDGVREQIKALKIAEAEQHVKWAEEGVTRAQKRVEEAKTHLEEIKAGKDARGEDPNAGGAGDEEE